MVLNYIWIAFFLIAFVVGLIKLIFGGDVNIFSAMFSQTIDMSKTAFEVSLGLTGMLSLWMGLLRVGEKAGVIKVLSTLIAPFFKRIFPQLSPNHPAYGSIVMNVAANMLGLDNAATPAGLKAMQQMQVDNPNKETASNPMIMFLVLNASGLTIIPISIMTFRAQLGAANPADVFLPILIATFCSTMAGFISVAIYQRINLWDKVILSYLFGLTAIIGAIVWYFSSLPANEIETVSKVASSVILFGIIISFLLTAAIKRINAYDAFIEGAKEGFQTAINIIPYLVAILVSIAVFRASGAMTYLTDGLGYLFAAMGVNTDFVPAIPTALMKPLSGSGARGMMIETMKTFGADSFPARVASVLQGSADTTFYIIAVYFGSVGVRYTRHAIACGLIADLFGFVAAVLVAYLFFY